MTYYFAMLIAILLSIWIIFGALNLVFYSGVIDFNTRTKVDIWFECIVFWALGPIGSYALLAHETNIIKNQIKKLKENE